MTDTTRRYSTREVRGRIWTLLHRHFLPLILALLILSLPLVAAGVLDGLADAYRLQLQEEKWRLWEQAQTPGWSEDPVNSDIIWNAWIRESEVESRADLCSLIAALLIIASCFFAMPLLPGVNRTLIGLLRGDNVRWQTARFTFAEFRRGIRLQFNILSMLLILSIPEFLLQFIANVVDGGAGEVGSFLNIVGSLVTFMLSALALLRYQLAPRFLATGAEGTGLELISRSAEILDNRSLLPQLSILFPGLLMLLVARILGAVIPDAFLPAIITGPLTVLMTLPGYAYLIAGSAAIFVTFRQE